MWQSDLQRKREAGGIEVGERNMHVQQMLDGDVRLDHEADERKPPIRLAPTHEQPDADRQPDNIGAEAGEAAAKRGSARRSDHAERGRTGKLVRTEEHTRERGVEDTADRAS